MYLVFYKILSNSKQIPNRDNAQYYSKSSAKNPKILFETNIPSENKNSRTSSAKKSTPASPTKKDLLAAPLDLVSKQNTSIEKMSRQPCINDSMVKPVHLFGTESNLPQSLQYRESIDEDEIQKLIRKKMQVLDKYNELICKDNNRVGKL